MSRLGPALIVLVAAHAAGCASSLILRPNVARDLSRKHPVDFRALHPAPEIVQVPNELGHQLTGYLFAQPGDRGTVIASGGNAMGADQTYLYNSYLLGHGFRVLVFTFQGYDGDSADADLTSLPGDAEAFYRFVRRRYPDEPVVYVASSASTAAALCMPKRAPDLAGLVLDSAVNLKTIPYAKLGEAWFLFPLYPLLFPAVVAVSCSVPSSLDPSRCLEEAPEVPALFLHNPKDRIAPMSAALALFAAYPGPAQFDKLTGGRGDPYHLVIVHDPEAKRRVLDFVVRRLRDTAASGDSQANEP